MLQNISFHLPQSQFAGYISLSGDFKLFLTSELMRLIGIQIYQIALPVLVVKISGSALMVGTFVALSGVSRISLMMLAGALSDRFSPQRVMLVAIIMRTTLLSSLVFLLFCGQASLGMIFGFSLAYGLVEALLLPSRGAILTGLVPKSDYLQANAWLAGLEQALMLAGPALVGLLISGFERSQRIASLQTYDLSAPTLALCLDALVTISAAALLWRLKAACTSARVPSPQAKPGLIASIRQVTRYAWRDGRLRGLLLTLGVLNVISTGPIWIGLPILVLSRFGSGAVALGLLTSSLGCGALVGSALSAAMPVRNPRTVFVFFTCTVMAVSASAAIILCTSQLYTSALAILAGATCLSYTTLNALAHIQRLTSPELMGRMMGLVNLK